MGNPVATQRLDDAHRAICSAANVLESLGIHYILLAGEVVEGGKMAVSFAVSDSEPEILNVLHQSLGE